MLCTNCEERPRAIVRKRGRRRRAKLCADCLREQLSLRAHHRGQVPAGTGHEPEVQQEVTNFCGARKKNGKPCEAEAGKGTDHLGFGPCKHHGGMTPAHQKAAAKMMARHHAVVMGAPVDIDPFAALLWTVRIAAGEVAYCNTMVATIMQSDAVARPVTIKRRPLSEGKDGEDPHTYVEEVTEHSPQLHLWIQTRRDALDRLAKFSKLAVDAGVAERQIQLAERYGEMIGRAIGNILDGLKLTKGQQQRAPELVRTHLAAIEGSATPVNEVAA